MKDYKLNVKDDNNLKISEAFYSVQGEGISTGVPAYFIRLQGCNLICGGKDGCLRDEGKATWYCDSETVWRQGENYTNEELVDKMAKDVGLESILNGETHLIWTGGEPLLPHHQKSISSFLEHMKREYGIKNIYNEIETNGTIPFTPQFGEDKPFRNSLYFQTDQINCSPKLYNSGMEKDKRINQEAIEMIRDHPNSWFKFVVSDEQDIKEMEYDFIYPYEIDKSQIILMPGVDNLDELSERTRFAYDMTKKYGYRSCTRGQVLAWDRVTGV